MSIIRLFFAFFILIQSLEVYAAERKVVIECAESQEKNVLLNGWYLWDPYQYNKVTAGGVVLTGMDIELVKNISSQIGIESKYEQVDWEDHQQDLFSGKRDMAAGATYTKERAEHVYFSEPYRYEENSLFIKRDSIKELNFDTVSEFLVQVRLQNFNLGVTKGFTYADPQINLFVSDPTNKDIIREYKNDVEALQALIKGDIDGLMSDRVVGAAAILNSKATSKIREIQLHVKTPIHMMFSKKSVPLDVVDKYNQAIRKFSGSDEYKDIVKTYLYPVMLLQTIDSQWFYFVGVIGTLAFAISGIAIAAKENATLFGTFLFAMLPSVGGGVMRDILINRDEVGLFLTPSYMYYILIVVLVGFSAVRLLEFYNKNANEDGLIMKFWDNTLVLGDALGQAAFIVTGVSIAIMARIEPIELWGPFFAFLTANSGGILRDLLRREHYIICLNGTINAEVSILWGLIFSLYLDITSYNPDPTGIRNAVIMVAIGAFVTRLVAHYFKIPNIKFRADLVETPAPRNLDVQDELDDVEEQKNYKQAKESKEFVSEKEVAEKIIKFKDPEEQKETKEPNEEKLDEGPKEPPKL
ncbi:MAG: transporter substrate-binding domain-containing protein [Rickettsiaceae bacterium]|nr:transporter substrate-binding domain-containing protein [Rickettsiaceae bacterium]